MPDVVLEATLHEADSLSASLHDGDALNATIGEVVYIHDAPYYEGDYEVTPSMSSDITLETDGLMMSDDVTVYKVPYSEVSNPAGGKTVTIGGE